jgi:pantoate--beta-alanine ligase
MQARVGEAPVAHIQYAEIVDADTLQQVEHLVSGRYLAALAVHFGATRLIDNTTLAVG